MSAQALPSEIQPLDRSIPHVDERRGRSPRRGRAFPDLRDEDDDTPRKPRTPALPVSDARDVEPEPLRPRVDVHVHH